MWLVLISKAGGYDVHSVHKSEQIAREWMRCKESDGEDVSIAEMSQDAIDEVVDLVRSDEGRMEKA